MLSATLAHDSQDVKILLIARIGCENLKMLTLPKRLAATKT